MARQFPRFLFSNPQNTKSKGPFIVHLLDPRIIFKVSKAPIQHNNSTMAMGTEHLSIVLLDEAPEPDEFAKVSLYEETMEAALLWIEKQWQAGEVNL